MVITVFGKTFLLLFSFALVTHFIPPLQHLTLQDNQSVVMICIFFRKLGTKKTISEVLGIPDCISYYFISARLHLSLQL